jgi:hypothetical protein
MKGGSANRRMPEPNEIDIETYKDYDNFLMNKHNKYKEYIDEFCTNNPINPDHRIICDKYSIKKEQFDERQRQQQQREQRQREQQQQQQQQQRQQQQKKNKSEFIPSIYDFELLKKQIIDYYNGSNIVINKDIIEQFTNLDDDEFKSFLPKLDYKNENEIINNIREILSNIDRKDKKDIKAYNALKSIGIL